jgi:excisionase family DNA binding protein
VSKLHATQPSVDKPEGIDIPYPRPMTKAELAEYLGVSPRTVDNYVSGRKIPFIKLGSRLIRFRLADVDRALKRYTVEEVSLS